ncbi:MAG: hypothetical protein DRI57_01645 [Deltaproteobacteria bacterium]|nr:MAG: hypothetical protein DRI57_01645 [Deltaproteobacteria bacterium]
MTRLWRAPTVRIIAVRYSASHSELVLVPTQSMGTRPVAGGDLSAEPGRITFRRGNPSVVALPGNECENFSCSQPQIADKSVRRGLAFRGVLSY